MEKRRGKRYKIRLKVRYGEEAPEHIGFIEDISSTGIRIKTNKVYMPGSIIKIEAVDDEKNEILVAEGLVRWSKRVPPSLVRKKRCGMGIAFLKIDANMHSFLIKLKRKHEDQGSG